MKCDNCGAELTQEAATCAYCGSRRPITSGASGEAGRADLFGRIKASPVYAERMAAQQLQNLPAVGAAARAIPVVFFVVFISVTLLISTTILGIVPGLAKIAVLVPLGMAVMGVLMMVHVWGRFKRFDQAEVEALPAIVSGKRTHVSGGSGSSSASTHYRIAFELEDGRRLELQPLDASLYGRVSEQDAGILYRRSDYALDFRRI